MEREKKWGKKPGKQYRLEQDLTATLLYFIGGHRAFHFLNELEKFSMGKVGLTSPGTNVWSTPPLSELSG